MAAWGGYRDDLVARQLAPATITTYRHALMGFWGHVGKRQWWQATPRDLNSYLGRGLSDNTRANLSHAVLLFYRWATAERLISRNPLAKATAVWQPEPIPRALELADVGALLEVVDDDDRMRLMVILAYGAGLRVGGDRRRAHRGCSLAAPPGDRGPQRQRRAKQNGPAGAAGPGLPGGPPHRPASDRPAGRSTPRGWPGRRRGLRLVLECGHVVLLRPRRCTAGRPRPGQDRAAATAPPIVA